MNQNSKLPNQKINVTDSSVEGQVGQAGRDLYQTQNRATIKGNVIQFINPDASFLQNFQEISSISTEIKLSSSRETSQLSQESLESMRQRLDEILDLVKDSNRHGDDIQHVKVGNVEISRVEALLKKAILLKAEADQMYFDSIERNKARLEEAKNKSFGNTFQVDLADLLVGFDESAHSAKLQEALNVLGEANKIEPTNTEVLIHSAQLLNELMPDNHYEVQKILNKVLSLLDHPQNDAERFQKGEAMFLLATSNDENVHTRLLQEARAIFQNLGEIGWVESCDNFLQPQSNVGFQESIAYENPSFQQPNQQLGFDFTGQWQVQITSGSSIFAQLYPNGACQGVQTLSFGIQAQFSGQWMFIPQTQTLQVQGFVNGFQPFMLSLAIQNFARDGFYAVGTDGFGYTFLRA
ncbi:hypothetical protein IQ254_07380 [Nodosilinea sp. LEGE 07088]|uniref:hypothetical protein n=1 Tax=Nodosilinea sp. LEGE 07088 TaxID=2777968 RepID=UPI0018809D7F|nr:hypothetical protein [Nodosilinea sp. LEGE 07088]MBE9137024.1 hypothetical protein [Nodosilinea sp. LEGE 07088]